jgi:NAD(P)-dependent dehydrogenase (short-subunit alcohol dehydrogenase family)
MKLKDEIAIVTGSGRGIGRAIAIGYAKEGANIVVVDKDFSTAKSTSKEIEKLGGNAMPVQTDVSNSEQVKTMVQRTLKEFSKIDILVNNAGVINFAPFFEVSEKDWNRIIDVNLKGTFLCAKYVAREMIKARKGKIINLASICSITAQEGLSVYEASKGGIAMFTKGMAVDLAPYGINVNAIAPGTIETDLNRKALANPGIRKKNIDHIPLRRLGKPEDVVGAAIFLATKDSDYVTGHVLYVDGGWVIK